MAQDMVIDNVKKEKAPLTIPVAANGGNPKIP
jgi:hypothetical protein